MVPAPRCAPGPRLRSTCTRRSTRPSATCCTSSWTRSSPWTRRARRCWSPPCTGPTTSKGVSNLAHKIVDLTDARALVLLVEMDERVFAVARSRTRRASTRPRSPLSSAGAGTRRRRRRSHARISTTRRRESCTALAEYLPVEALRAADVMSSPARSVGPDTTVREAMALCQRHGQSGVFVVDEGRVSGAVAREDLDKAIGHGLAHAPVRGIMSGRVVTVSEDATLAELQMLVTSASRRPRRSTPRRRARWGRRPRGSPARARGRRAGGR